MRLLKPQDILVLLRLALSSSREETFNQLNLSNELGMVPSEISRLLQNMFEMNVQKLGFKRDTKDRINCRWRSEAIVVDFMPGNQIAGYINNKWYQAAMEYAEKLQLSSGKTVKIISPIYLMATKLEAFHSRGKLKIPEIFDGEANKDLEDIVHLIEGRDVLLNELNQAPLSVQAYVKSQLNKIIANPLSEDFINNCFGGALGSKRAQYVKDQISKIILQS